MELQQFKYFLAVARCEHLTKAAEELNIAQPALSQSIRRLEADLGVPLFDRSGHKIALNPQGKFLKERLEPMMDSLMRLPSELQQSLYESSHKIHLNIRAASYYITKYLIAYRTEHPDIQFYLTQYNYDAPFDIDVTTELPAMNTGSKYEKQIILAEDVCLAVPLTSPFAQKTYINLTDTCTEGYVVLNRSWKLRRICDEFCRRAHFSPKIVFESNNPDTTKNLIAAGIGIGFWPPLSWGYADKTKLKLLPIRHPECRRHIIINMTGTGIKNPVVLDFFNYLEEHIS